MALSPSVVSGSTSTGKPVIRKNSLIPDDYEPVPVSYLDLGEGRRVAYRKFEGHLQPTILYIPGFFASMNLPKTVILEVFARKHGYSNVRYDQECVGLSTGDQPTIEFEHWLDDALAMVDRVCDGPVVLVASSVGAWITTLVAQRRPERIHGIIFLGPGFNALRPSYWQHYNLLSPEEKEKVDLGLEHVKINMRYGGVGIMRRDFCENTAKFEIDFSKPIDIRCPVRIVHAVKDVDIPYQSSLLLMERIVSEDVDLVLRKTGNHRLMTQTDLVLLLSELERMLKQYPVPVDRKKSTLQQQPSVRSML
jgi:abhydrolase domain-containing protein 10